MVKTKEEWNSIFKKQKIVAKKYNGDDHYSWAVFKEGIPVYTGLSKSETDYYKRLAAK